MQQQKTYHTGRTYRSLHELFTTVAIVAPFSVCCIVRIARFLPVAAMSRWGSHGWSHWERKQGRVQYEKEPVKVGFYNVGIKASEVGGRQWDAKQEALKYDIEQAFRHHQLHALCLSEVGEINKAWGICCGGDSRFMKAWKTG